MPQHRKQSAGPSDRVGARPSKLQAGEARTHPMEKQLILMNTIKGKITENWLQIRIPVKLVILHKSVYSRQSAPDGPAATSRINNSKKLQKLQMGQKT